MKGRKTKANQPNKPTNKQKSPQTNKTKNWYGVCILVADGSYSCSHVGASKGCIKIYSISSYVCLQLKFALVTGKTAACHKEVRNQSKEIQSHKGKKYREMIIWKAIWRAKLTRKNA